MADKNNDGLFHWNFDLKESDSDFTDIDYTADTIPEAEGSEDIQPFIFVDGKYKSDGNAGTFVDDYLSGSSQNAGKRTDRINKDQEEEDYLLGYKKPAEKKPAAKKQTARPAQKKKTSGGGNDFMETLKGLNWKLIGIIAAAVIILIVLLLVIFRKKPEEKVDWAVSEDEEILTLINSYYDAVNEGNATTIRSILIPDAQVNASQVSLASKIYESFLNRKVYSIQGKAKDETALFVTYDTKFKNIDDQIPTFDFFYILTDKDEKGNKKGLRLVTKDEPGMAENGEYYQYVANKYVESEEMLAIGNKIQSDYQQYLTNHPTIAAYFNDLKNGDIIPYDPADYESQVATTEAPVVTTTEAPASTQYNPTGSTQETTLNVIGYCTTGLNLRQTPSMGNNVIGSFAAGHSLQVMGEMDDWYHVKDVLTTDSSGNPQTPSGQEGYVAKKYLSVPQN